MNWRRERCVGGSAYVVELSKDAVATIVVGVGQ